MHAQRRSVNDSDMQCITFTTAQAGVAQYLGQDLQYCLSLNLESYTLGGLFMILAG